jgi:large subunit ribosomal protein L7/L12
MAEEEKKEEVSQTEETKKEEVKEEPVTKEEPKVEEQKKEEDKKEVKKEEVKEKEEEEEVEVPKKFEKIVKEIEEMKVVDLAELVKILEKKFGVSATAPVAAVGAPVAGVDSAGEEEKSEYNIILKTVGDKKIEVIKAVRDATAKGLKESKDMVDAAGSEPQTVREGVKKEEAEEIKKKFETAGATVELK